MHENIVRYSEKLTKAPQRVKPKSTLAKKQHLQNWIKLKNVQMPMSKAKNHFTSGHRLACQTQQYHIYNRKEKL